jgi:uncharacterized membrane protein
MTSRLRIVGLLALAGAGIAISAYVAAFQLGVLTTVWDPIFGAGSQRVLTSPISRALPVPDGVVGILGYSVDAALAAVVIATADRRALFALGAVASLGAIAAIALVVLQPFAVGALCSLCLLSAAISTVLAIGTMLEIRATPSDQALTRPAPTEASRS